MITEIKNENQIEYLCRPAQDIELLERNPLIKPEIGDTFFCHPKDGELFKLIVIDINNDYDVKVANNGKVFWYYVSEYRYILLSVPTDYFHFYKTN